MDEEPSGIQELIIQINKNYQELLGYSAEKTRLNKLNSKRWTSFCKEFNFDKNSSGIYLPRNQTAIIPAKNKLSLFHEYFGHGLYCEQSLPGRELVNLERSLMEEEKEYFKDKQFTSKEINEFRKRNKTFQLLKRL